MEIEIKGAIEDIKGSTGITDMGDPDISLKIKVQLGPSAYARLMNLQKQRVPMYLIIGSAQAAMDLEMVSFSDSADRPAVDTPASGNGDSELPGELGIMSLAPDSTDWSENETVETAVSDENTTSVAIEESPEESTETVKKERKSARKK